MQFKQLTVALAAVSAASAQRPSNVSICDYYTTALLKNNTAANQLTLLTLIVNTVVIGNCKCDLVPVAADGTTMVGCHASIHRISLCSFF